MVIYCMCQLLLIHFIFSCQIPNELRSSRTYSFKEMLCKCEYKYILCLVANFHFTIMMQSLSVNGTLRPEKLWKMVNSNFIKLIIWHWKRLNSDKFHPIPNSLLRIIRTKNCIPIGTNCLLWGVYPYYGGPLFFHPFRKKICNCNRKEWLTFHRPDVNCNRNVQSTCFVL